MTINLSERETLLVLNRDFQQLSQRFTELAGEVKSAQEQLRRGGQRFAKIDLQMQAIEAAINGLRLDYSRAMADVERLQVRIVQLDAQYGATSRLANKVQLDLAALQKEHDRLAHVVTGERGNDDDRGMEGDVSRLKPIVYALAVAVVLVAVYVVLK